MAKKRSGFWGRLFGRDKVAKGAHADRPASSLVPKAQEKKGLSEAAIPSPSIGQGGMANLQMKCGGCGHLYIIGEDADLITHEDVRTFANRTLVMGGGGLRNDLVATVETTSGQENNLKQAREKIELVKLSLERGEQRVWTCHACNKTNPWPQMRDARTPPTREWTAPIKSELLPDFPLNPQNLCYEGGKLDGRYLLNIYVVIACILTTFEVWCKVQDATPQEWPEATKRELDALRNSAKLIGSRVNLPVEGHYVEFFRIPVEEHDVDVARIAALFAEYLKCFISDKDSLSEFMNERISLYYLLIDFTKTIACANGIQLALRWYGR